MTEQINPLSLLPETAFNRTHSTKFAPKLSFDERCSVLALVRANVSRKIVSEALGIDRRTVGHITNETSLHYRNVRQEYKRIGHDDFIAKYVTEEVARKVAEVANKPVDVVHATGNPSERARAKAGVHTVKPEQCSYSHRLEIKFFHKNEDEGIAATGWHYRDLDSKTDSDTWFHNGEESLMSSSAAFAFAQDNLTDD